MQSLVEKHGFTVVLVSPEVQCYNSSLCFCPRGFTYIANSCLYNTSYQSDTKGTSGYHSNKRSTSTANTYYKLALQHLALSSTTANSTPNAFTLPLPMIINVFAMTATKVMATHAIPLDNLAQ